MAADLDSLITSEIPEGRQNLLDSHTNLEKVAEYCENNYFQSENKRAALEETKGYTTQSLASVAYQINTLAYNFLQMLDLQSSQIQEMESQINHISQTVSIHKEKVARREIGVLTTNKCSNRQHKIIAPANPERPIKYVRKPIDYGCLDEIGHGVKIARQNTPRQLSKRPSTSSNSPYGPGNQYSGQYGPGGVRAQQQGQYGSIGNVSQNSAGPAPTTKPPTPPQNRIYQSGTLTRNKSEYRTPPVVAPPQVPSNYAPNYPKTSRAAQQQYGTLPHQHPQVGMVYPQPQEGGATMPRLSSHSMRSTHSAHSGTPTPPPQEGTYGVTRKPSTSSGDGDMYGLMRQTSQSSSVSMQSAQQLHALNQSPYGLSRGTTPPSAYGKGGGAEYGMTRPVQRPPSPPGAAPPIPSQAPPMSGMQPNNPIYGRQGGEKIYSRQQSDSSVYGSRAQPGDPSSVYGSRAQPGDPSSVYGTRGDPNALYGTRQQVVQEQTYQSRAGLNYSRQTSGSSIQSNASLQQAPPPQSVNSSTSVVVQDMSLPGWVPKVYLDKVLAIYDYNADKEDELTFQEGQIIYVLKKNDDGWWEGVMEGITGLFPGNYVEQTV